jgi:sugar phosphate isomerase/epimerase
MLSRRAFLTTVAAGAGASAIRPAWAALPDPPEIKTALKGSVGVQLWSFREYLPKDLPGTLSKIRALGFREVEGAGLWGHKASELRAALDAAALRCRSAHMQFERLRDDASGAFAEAKTLGASWVICPWIPHTDNKFTRDDAVKAAEAFDKWGTAAAKAGLGFGYHPHGYDFFPSDEGTLLDTMARATNPKRVAFQIDVFHAFHGGADPAKLIERYKDRVVSLHLKDLKKGVPVKVGTAIGTPEDDVPVGTGQIDMPAVFRAAQKAGVKLYYIEDESADPWGHIPETIKYLESVKST